MDDLRRWVKRQKPEMQYLIDTNYLLSHLEQEIMYLSWNLKNKMIFHILLSSKDEKD